jgi:PAS domain S-box-containing protein
VAILLLDERGCVVGWNQGAERLLGYTAAEVLGSSFERFFTPEDVRSGVPKRELRDATKGGAPDRNWIVRKDGSRFWGSGNTKAVRNSSGKVVCLVKVITDLTALHRLEVERAAALAREQAALAQAHAAEELRVADERFHVLVYNIADYAIFLLDPDGIIRSWNEGAERIKGYREAEIVGKNFAVFYTPEDRANGIPERNLRIAAAEGRLESEGWRIRKDGSRFWAHVVITALRDARGELTGFAKVTQDLTEKEQATRDRLRLAQEQAARAAAEVAERRLAMQLSITRVLAETATLDEAIPRILQAIGEGLDWDWGTFWNVDPLANLLRCARVWHTPDAADSELEQAVRQLALAPGVGLPGRVWSTGQPVWIPDVVQDPGVALR